MKNSFRTVNLTLWINRLVILTVVVLMFTLPTILQWYQQYRVLLKTEQTALTAAFYCCSVVVLFALWQLDTLLRNIRAGEVFIRDNVRLIRRVQWCCAATALICVPATVCYYPLVFMTVVMGFLSLVVCVVTQVMDAAVTIREENDLTI